MMIATVTTCPQRWRSYQRLRRQFERLHMPIPLRTFQTPRQGDNPRINNNLNARAALWFACQHLEKVNGEGWVLYLEDDVLLHAALPQHLAMLTGDFGYLNVGCWYLCNRKNPVREQIRIGACRINKLDDPVAGTHGLLIRKDALPLLLEANWDRYADQVVFSRLREAGVSILQVIDPVLVEHAGGYSTFSPQTHNPTEINHASSSDTHPAR